MAKAHRIDLLDPYEVAQLGGLELVAEGVRFGCSAGERPPSAFGSRPHRCVVSSGCASWPRVTAEVTVSAAAPTVVFSNARRVTPSRLRTEVEPLRIFRMGRS